ncbi:MAG TPA: cyclic peptide export ABC transporter [Thermoanaerobaculia bacterium]|nr:cyclic peptide export ABC transporter [Thermoanaerobaculia bacterium]
MKSIRFLLSRARGTVLLAIVAGLVSGASSTGLLALINYLLTGGQAPRSVLLWTFIGLCAVVPLSRVVSELLLARLGQETIFQMRMEISRRVLAVPLRRLEELGAPRVLSTLTEDVPTITNLVGLIPVLCINAATAVGCLAYLGWLSWKVLLVLLVIMFVGVVGGYQLPLVRAVRYMRRARGLNDDLYQHFRALTDGAKELKLHRPRRDAFLAQELETTAGDFRDQNILGMRIYTIASSWGQLLVFVIIGLLLFALPAVASTDVKLLSGYALTLLYLMTPLQMLMGAAPTFGRASVALARVDGIGLELARNASPEFSAPVRTEPSWRRLELRGITHAYRREGEEGEFVLGPIDMTLRPGELVFIAGGNGSGKTTLAKLLTGLYAPESGQILLDGAPVTDDSRESYRQLFSAVFSDFFLFRQLLGLESPELDGLARRYLDQLHLGAKVQVQDGKLSSTELSQGQRKRLALLTACLEDRPIYLFDEWAADQDPVFKEIFYHQLLPSLTARGKTAVVISHDDRYYNGGDRTFKLEQGRIVAEEVRTPAPEAVLA